MSVAVKRLSAVSALALTLGILTQPSGPAAQVSRGAAQGAGVPVLKRPARHFDRTIRRARRRSQRHHAHDASPGGRAKPPAASAGYPSPESVGVPSSTLEAVAQCESGGDPAAVSADGTYRGLYQFDSGTWASVGGSGDPAAASPDEQTYRAALLYARSGSNPWPVCGS